MRTFITTLASLAMLSALALAQAPSPKEASAQTLTIKYSEEKGDVTVTVGGSMAMEGTLLFGKIREKWMVRAWFRAENGDPFFSRTVTDPASVTLDGASLPVASVDEGGKGFKDPGDRQWTLVKGDKTLVAPKPAKEGENPPPLKLKGKTVWTKSSPESLELTDDAGRTWRYTAPKEEAPKQQPKKKSK